METKRFKATYRVIEVRELSFDAAPGNERTQFFYHMQSGGERGRMIDYELDDDPIIEEVKP